MSNPSLIKGNKLEKAVELIEKTIFETNPSFKNSKLTIEPKKVIINEGARYEIDFYVEIDQGFGYKAVFIFECKNWKDDVSRNQITEFSEKIEITKAQKGFFIAKNYTSGAEARAKQDKRIELLKFEEDVFDLTNIIQFEFIDKTNKIKSLDLIDSNIDNLENSKKEIIDLKDCKIIYKGQEGNLKNFVDWLLNEMANDHLTSKGIKMSPGTKYFHESKKEIDFNKREFILKGPINKDIGKIKVEAIFEMEIIRPKIISHIDVKTRGRLIEYESIKTLSGRDFKFELVLTNN